MTLPAVKLATYADLEKLPESDRVELIDGVIVAMPAPLPRHSKTAGAVRRFIGGPYDDDDGYGGPGGWWIFAEVDVLLNLHNVVRPDLSGWLREHLPDPGDVRPIGVTPDWICEVISPSNAAHDRVKKRRMYAAAGVSYYWLIDPAERVLEALRLQVGKWEEVGVYDDTATSVRIAPFADVELDVSRLFLPR